MKTVKQQQVWDIEDDDVLRRQHGELIRGSFPGVSVELFSDTRSAWRAEGTPAVILLDLGGVYGSHFGGQIEAYSMHVEAVAKKHPGAVLGVYSAVGGWADSVIEEVRKTCPDNVMEPVDAHDHEKLIEFLSKWLVGERRAI